MSGSTDLGSGTSQMQTGLLEAAPSSLCQSLTVTLHGSGDSNVPDNAVAADPEPSGQTAHTNHPVFSTETHFVPASEPQHLQYVDLPIGRSEHTGTLRTLNGVLIPACENMWGVLIFLRFFYVVGQGGVVHALVITFISYICAFLTVLSLSAIATNGPIERGGVYFLISRALGPKIGGSVGCLYFIGIALLAVMEVLGAVEMLFHMAPVMNIAGVNRGLAAVAMLVLAGAVFLGIRFVSKLGAVFALVVVLTLASFYVGLGLAPFGEGLEDSALTGLSGATLSSNMGPGYDEGVSFSTLVALFFPCFTGFLSGADRANSLRDPVRAIPIGTLGAITFSLVMYISFFVLWGAVAERDYLKYGPQAHHTSSNSTGHRMLNSGGSSSLEVVSTIAWPSSIATEIGIIIASIAQALQCFVVAPRLLQAIAADRTIPFSTVLAPDGQEDDDEPRRTLLATTVLCIAASMIGSLDVVAPLVSICFLLCYGCLNLSTFVLSVMRAPNWRPRFRYCPWLGSLIGFAMCIALMFIIEWISSLVALAILVALYAYIDWKAVKVDWGTGLGGLRLQWATTAMLSLRHEQKYFVNWRPQLLLLHRWTPPEEEDAVPYEEMIDLASQLKKGKGLCVMAVVVEGRLVDEAENAEALTEEVEKAMETAGLHGFCNTVVAPSFREGKTAALQLAGLGPMTPNTVLLSWPHHFRLPGCEHEADIFVEVIAESTKMHKAMLIAFNLRNFPKLSKLQGVIDVWWIMHDGGLLILMAHLLTRHRIWHGCAIRVFVVAGRLDNSIAMQNKLESLLKNARISAKVEVVELENAQDLVAYTHDWTLRVNEAKRFQASVKALKAQEGSPASSSHEMKAVDSKRKLHRDIFSPPNADEADEGDPLDPTSESDPAGKSQRVVLEEDVKIDIHNSKSIPQELDFLPGMRHDSERPRGTKWTSSSSNALNKLIRSKSKDAQLVVVNLPDPIRNIPPPIYMNYCEDLVKGIRRVLFVHGTGNEVWTH
eukprot:GGOE01045015.1.p1 GENE.GGOE01045015.1~~GGOE01045015.1.p1  ORF type:complete len:1030 (-),score=323.02 GGOE01045015.1:171-3164(-)